MKAYIWTESRQSQVLGVAAQKAVLFCNLEMAIFQCQQQTIFNSHLAQCVGCIIIMVNVLFIEKPLSENK